MKNKKIYIIIGLIIILLVVLVFIVLSMTKSKLILPEDEYFNDYTNVSLREIKYSFRSFHQFVDFDNQGNIIKIVYYVGDRELHCVKKYDYIQNEGDIDIYETTIRYDKMKQNKEMVGKIINNNDGLIYEIYDISFFHSKIYENKDMRSGKNIIVKYINSQNEVEDEIFYGDDQVAEIEDEYIKVYKYDSKGNIVSEKCIDKDDEIIEKIEYKYNKDNQLIYKKVWDYDIKNTNEYKYIYY